MPKAILAIRSCPATLLLAMLLFLATLILTTGSLGKVGADGGSGDSGDGGSGIGGTGRSAEFGGSGFGGTGGPSPFLTKMEEEQHSAPEPAVPTPFELQVRELTTELASGEPQDSAILMIEDSLSDAIEEAVAQHPLAQESSVILTVDDAVAEGAVAASVDLSEPAQFVSQPLQVVEAKQLEPSTSEQVDSSASSVMPLQGDSYSTVADHTAEVESETESEVMPQVAETVPVKLETAPEAIEPEIDRRSLPDRIQRPDLPPFQRIRPVERASIMPPRVQPMRI